MTTTSSPVLIILTDRDRAELESLARARKAPLRSVQRAWLNQIEIYFSIVQRKVIKPANFADLNELEQRLLAFEARYNATASPFDWRYTKDDLNAYPERLAAHEPLSPAA